MVVFEMVDPLQDTLLDINVFQMYKFLSENCFGEFISFLVIFSAF